MATAAAVCLSMLLGCPAGFGAQILVEGQTGEVLVADDALALWHPASLTKMMTVYLALEALQLGAMEPSDRLEVSDHAAAQPPTDAGLAAGDEITVERAIEAVIVRSANDAAAVLAEAMAGSEDAFAGLMTTKAQELGMTATVFRNATGLPNPDQVTTARDMAILARALIRNFPLYYGLFSERSVTLGGRVLPTYNGLLVSYDGADGLKTGFTCASGYNVVTSARRNGRRLIGVVLGSKNGGARNMQMRALLDRGFRTDAGKVDGTTLVDLGMDGSQGAPARPPRVLSPEECGRQPEALAREAPPGAKGLPPIMSGWGIMLGAYADRAEAQSKLAAARKTAGGSGRATVIEKRVGKIRRFTALITNLTQSDAASLCRTLQKRKSYCLAVGPAVLTNSRSKWW